MSRAIRPLRHLLSAVPSAAELRHPRPLFRLLEQLRMNGVGYRVTRAIWSKYEDCYYTVTTVKKKDVDAGKVWGVLTWKGKTSETPQRIRSHRKGQWYLVEECAPSKPRKVRHIKRTSLLENLDEDTDVDSSAATASADTETENTTDESSGDGETDAGQQESSEGSETETDKKDS